MGSTSWSRSRAAVALLCAAALAGPAAAQLYRHPRALWMIDFPPGWTVAERTPRGAVATAPKGVARLAVSKRLTDAADARAELGRRAAADRRLYGAARVKLAADVTVRGAAGRRVEFEFEEPGTGRAMKGWRTVLVRDGVADEVAFEAAAEDYAPNRAAAEAALRSFLPSFAKAGAEPR